MVRDALGDELERNTIAGAADRRRPGADARRQPPGARPSEVLAGIGRDLPARTARRRSSWTRGPPRSWRWRTGPASTPPTRRAEARTSSRNMATGLHLRAGLDLQGVHGRRRARGGPGHAATRCSTCRPTIQVADRTIEESHAARLREPLGRRHPRPVLERRRGRRSGSSSAPTTFDHWIRALRLRRADRGPVPGRGAGDRDPGRRTTRARRWATCRSARASRSPRCRWPPPTRRSPTAASCARPRLVLAEDGEKVARRPGRAGDQPRQRREAAARCSRASSRRAAPPRRSSVPGYTLAGKTGTAQKVVDGTYSETEFVASFVGFAPAAGPAAAGRGRRRQPEGRHLRRHGRRAGVRRDRQVRAALPGHPAAVTGARPAPSDT